MSSRDKWILWHVSAHGWGHAARQRELIRELKKNRPEVGIALVSSAPDWFWQDTPAEIIIRGNPSPVAVERNGLPDRELTALNLSSFIRNSKDLLNRELDLQRKTGANLVITDIDPLPVKAAEINSIPALGIGNFTWDWILRDMCPGMKEETEKVESLYRSGTYLRLPLGPDHSPFRNTISAPLLRGGPSGSLERVERLLPPGGTRCLAAFRKLPEGFPVRIPEGISPFSSMPEALCPAWLNISPDVLGKSGAHFADLVAGADVIIAKPGYGIVSQILCMGKKAVLVSGSGFPEEPFLLHAVERRVGTRVLDRNSISQVFPVIEEIKAERSPFPVPSSGISDILTAIYKMLV